MNERAKLQPPTGVDPPPIRAVFCWAEVSRYMAACWRALTQRPGMEVHVIHPERLFGKTNPFHSDPQLLQGISQEMFNENDPALDERLLRAVSSRRPHVIVLCGWFFGPYRKLVASTEMARTPVVLGMDTPWRGTIAQHLTRYRFARLFRRLAMVVTAGERSSEYARRLGVAEKRIQGGYYGFDHELFGAAAAQRRARSGSWPRQFLFAGRYLAKKGVTTLVQAYQTYRASVTDPWGLTCCGAGPEAGRLQGIAGVTDAGFTKPNELPAVFARHGAFVLPSHFEPWGVVIAEAAASGLPVVCSTACGAGLDVVRPYYNGLMAAPRDAEGLAAALRWIHDHEAELPAMGERSRALAAPYSAESWARRWHNYLLEILETPVAN